MTQPAQTYENHAKIVPAYHYFTFGLIALNLVYRLYAAAVGFGIDTLMSLLAAVALMMVFFFARVFALKVQDRVIRIEMRQRLAQLAPDLDQRFDELNVDQLCSLRFASDGELPELTRVVLAEKLSDRKAIKKMIRDWQADLLRA